MDRWKHEGHLHAVVTRNKILKMRQTSVPVLVYDSSSCRDDVVECVFSTSRSPAPGPFGTSIPAVAKRRESLSSIIDEESSRTSREQVSALRPSGEEQEPKKGDCTLHLFYHTNQKAASLFLFFAPSTTVPGESLNWFEHTLLGQPRTTKHDFEHFTNAR